jgi:hypothetical protein
VTTPPVAVTWLGGKDNFASDRELGDTMLRVYPLAAPAAKVAYLDNDSLVRC